MTQGDAYDSCVGEVALVSPQDGRLSDEFGCVTTTAMIEYPTAFDTVLDLFGAKCIPDSAQETMDLVARELILEHKAQDTFYIVDLAQVHRLYDIWTQALPRVRPFYAVKCNNNKGLLMCLAALGAGFDCASEEEVHQVLSLGVSPDRIIFANPCKKPKDIAFSSDMGVSLTTFDSICEVQKLSRWAPGCRAVLRIRADDTSALCQLGNKFGAEEWEWPSLFAEAIDCGINIVGVSFHVGSMAHDPEAFCKALCLAKKACDLGAQCGFNMTLVDIGGGFSISQDDIQSFGKFSSVLQMALDEYFPESSQVSIIAEPGRFFAESIATLCTLVYGKRSRSMCITNNGMNTELLEYWITDGIYGSMNCLLYDHATLRPRPLSLSGLALPPPTYTSTIFGPTCDGLDTVLQKCHLPELDIGDWILFPRMGAYSISGASKFNGINAVDVPHFYVCSNF